MIKLEDISEDDLVQIVREAKKVKGSYLKIVIPFKSVKEKDEPPIIQETLEDEVSSKTIKEEISMGTSESSNEEVANKPGKIECFVCGQKFLTRIDCGIHHYTTHTEKGEKNTIQATGNIIFTCTVCQKEIRFATAYLDHVMGHANINHYKCSECNCTETFSCRKKLYWHRKEFHREKSFSCEMCDKRFSTKSAMKRHVDRHLGLKKFHCPVCPKKYTEVSSLSKHLKIHTIIRVQRHICEHCGETYGCLQSLNRHLKTHSTPKLNTCKTCGKSFHRKRVLEAHRRIHSGYKPYQCSHCGLTFTQKGTLSRHYKSHSIMPVIKT